MAAEICLLGTFRGALQLRHRPWPLWGLLGNGAQKETGCAFRNPCSGLTVGNGWEEKH